LRHPDLFFFAGGLSSAIDVPSTRLFHQEAAHQSRHYNSIFGPLEATPVVTTILSFWSDSNPEAAPYFFLTCGEQEGLLPGKP
jgi:hypothetical protein